MTDITTIGEILIDLTQTGTGEQGVPLFAANPGGAPANVAVAAARLGAKTAFIGKVGRDPLGDFLTRTLRESGVDVSQVRGGAQPTTMAVVSVSPSGERSFRFMRGADRDLSPEEVRSEMVEQSKILHFGSVSLTSGLARSATVYAARHAHHSGVLVSYDPNYRAALWNSEESAAEWMRLPLPLVDLLKLSEEELPLLSGSQDLEAGTAALEAQGVKLILVTLGSKGVFWRWRGQTGGVPGVKTAVADTNGAGDTFLGAVLSRLTRREGKAPLEDLSPAELEEVLAFANRAAAVTCSRSGAIPAMPWLRELEG